MGAIQVQKVGWWHERLADWMIANPDKTLTQAAKMFDCSVNWISIVKNSDSFKEYWVERSADASFLNGTTTLLAKTGAIADMALDRLAEKIENSHLPGEQLTAPVLLDIADTALKRLGYGTKPNGGATANTNVQVNIGIISPEKLKAAREKMQQLHGVSVTQVDEMSAGVEAELIEEVRAVALPSRPIRRL